MDRKQLQQQNQEFADTDGISSNNQEYGFKPAFRDQLTGRVELARLENGQSAPVHVISGLPDDWAIERDGNGLVKALKPSIEAGFVKGDKFLTRAEAISACQSSEEPISRR